ncbi:Polyisoprenoid-binding protein YceI [Chitinophaga terrae (ex Kim and Jung 2007)]|uniref:Polyisoprenoid-binding protein YceI n=1 Tax=Chitinophaga terrae (ex Kim and Jung 2007) TaxID=408074 RepID=A0A1H4FDR5_9BACT|nr:YceI family protein [Chitinophaga terrae (ex Kim and Jung 2007)]MDQ0110171.1 polyisoprenoid-binding protein YceI [Chitinophaga terrae (ex Kim and Jung 2007)]GEP92408.1 polyisoprenoid-binding protein [Chitinophaga terrae (ex Kim and Jung 2007)]SEA95493.1 Polyisoprenoid-binding protein YceI [Chitinophaga terrae (ex Kim and Jung 2007)]
MTNWIIDESHSEIGFKVKHLMITNVSGYFTRFNGQVQTASDDFHDASISFEAAADSIDTQNKQRDEHLKNGEFFDASNYPKISFVSKKVKKIDNENYKLTGDLTIKGETHPIELDVHHTGLTVDPYGQQKAGFSLKGRLHRTDYGLRWNATTEAGGIVLSDEVKLNMEIQLVRQ